VIHQVLPVVSLFLSLGFILRSVKSKVVGAFLQFTVGQFWLILPYLYCCLENANAKYFCRFFSQYDWRSRLDLYRPRLRKIGLLRFSIFLHFFLIAQTDEGGLALSQTDALSAYGGFTLLVYLSSLIGGVIGDLVLGAHKASLLGVLIMTAGYFGLTLVYF
jgi:hypothetical protein